MNRALWIAQWLLALIFLVAGAMKLIAPIADLTKQIPLPGPFLRFIAVCEVTGALGLILPGLLRIRQGLIPLAAACLVIIMIGATSISATHTGLASAVLPFLTGVLAAFVAWGRWKTPS